MGKSPGRWIKSILLRKKSSKLNLSKGKDISKPARKEEVLGSAKAPVPELTVKHPFVLPPASGLGAKSGVDTECEAVAELSTEGVTKDKNANEITFLTAQEDTNAIRQEKAATKAQAAVRGFLARRAFRTLKGILTLQSIIRGHLVRRQAAATLYCVRAIIKFQAVARGRSVRCSIVGVQVQNACNLAKLQDVKCTDSSLKFVGTSGEPLILNVIAQKLLVSSLSWKPLCLQYGHGEPNSAWEWLERWTRSHFWVPYSKPKKYIESKSQIKHDDSQRVRTEHVRPKRNVRKLENGSIRSSSETDKSKQNERRLSIHQSNSFQEHPQAGKEKIKLNSIRTFDSRKETSEGFEVDKGKTKHSVRKESVTATYEVSEQGNNDCMVKVNDVAVSVSKLSDDDDDDDDDDDGAGVECPAVDDPVGASDDHPVFDLQPVDNSKVHAIHGLNLKDQSTSIDNQKNNNRRTSFPPNVKLQENGVQATRKLPSYMAPTESARARLKGQGSLRFSQDAVEKNGITRRHSLPSSTNGKLTTMSPRALRLVQTAGKEAIRGDRSLSSSRDGSGSDRVTKPEWRR